MGPHDDIGVVRGDNVRRRPRDIVDAATGIMEDDFDFAAKNATAAVDFGSGQQGTIGAGRAPYSRRTGQCNKVRNPNFLAIPALTKQARRWHRGPRTEPWESPKQPFRGHVRP